MTIEFDRSRVTVVDHPLVQHKLTIMRSEQTGSKQFRELVKELALFEGYEATRDFPLEDIAIKTPICETTGKQISGRKVAIVPILRAGLGMVDGLLELIPAARVGHVGMYRDEVTHEPHEYYAKLPGDLPVSARVWWLTPCWQPVGLRLRQSTICVVRVSRISPAGARCGTRGYQDRA